MSETAENDTTLCDLCGHETHHDTDCGEVTGYDHLNGDHECGCPGSLTFQLAQAWDKAHDLFCPRGLVCSTHGRPGDRYLLGKD